MGPTTSTTPSQSEVAQATGGRNGYVVTFQLQSFFLKRFNDTLFIQEMQQVKQI